MSVDPISPASTKRPVFNGQAIRKVDRVFVVPLGIEGIVTRIDVDRRVAGTTGRSQNVYTVDFTDGVAPFRLEDLRLTGRPTWALPATPSPTAVASSNRVYLGGEEPKPGDVVCVGVDAGRTGETLRVVHVGASALVWETLDRRRGGGGLEPRNLWLIARNEPAAAGSALGEADVAGAPVVRRSALREDIDIEAVKAKVRERMPALEQTLAELRKPLPPEALKRRYS